MLADLEWKTPHPRPGGRSVAEWVEGVRWFERNGFLREPVGSPCAGRCRHNLPLAIREWMPEIAIFLAQIRDMPVNRPNSFDEEKLHLLRELIK